MSSLREKKILIGVTGGIAAYKTPILVRLLKKLNAEVKVVMTESAKEFVTPLTLSTTSQNPVVSSFKSDDDSTWNNHVELGLWADFFIIYPATANTLFKMANGNCDNLLIATYLSCKSKVFFSPAMEITSAIKCSLFSSKNEINSFKPSLDLNFSETYSPSIFFLLSVIDRFIPLFKKESSLIRFDRVS